MTSEDPGGEPLLSPSELAVYASAFREGGFTAPINWYRNFSHNWKTTRGLVQQVRVPTLFVTGTEEAFSPPRSIDVMRRHVDDLEVEILDGCGHWTQQEQPEAMNRVVLDWLSRRYPASAA